MVNKVTFVGFRGGGDRIPLNPTLHSPQGSDKIFLLHAFQFCEEFAVNIKV